MHIAAGKLIDPQTHERVVLNGDHKMSIDDRESQIIERFVDRDKARLPDFFLRGAKGVVVAGAGLLRAAELPLWLDCPLGWSTVDENCGRSCGGELEVARLGDYWFIGRMGQDETISETVVEAFGQVPICARACGDAMLLAEHCHPSLHLPIGAQWVKF